LFAFFQERAMADEYGRPTKIKKGAKVLPYPFNTTKAT
jgi:hypothetical protein